VVSTVAPVGDGDDILKFSVKEDCFNSTGDVIALVEAIASGRCGATRNVETNSLSGFTLLGSVCCIILEFL